NLFFKSFMDVHKDILKKCRKNDRRAQFELYELCYPILMSVCLRYERNKESAEELLNLGFYKILTKLDKYDPKVPFEAWIRRVTINTVIDEFRKKSRDKHTFLEKLEGTVPIANMSYNEADLKFDAAELEEMIRQLPETSQKVFNLYIVDGYNHKEIGKLLGISEGTSKWHLSTSRKTLKKRIIDLTNKVASFL
ncbi:MAG: sigma-70 family RNA polymerase sigma factor, partial [Methylococcales bacterium]|nr:sigma-70 family RNA polymerase sigma factor [Methylococcales bacterium]